MEAEERIEYITEVSCHERDYVVEVYGDWKNELRVQVEDKHTGEIWVNTFAWGYVEQITQKTGNFKRYSIFVKMLLSALAAESESVFLDILSTADLEALKARKQQQRSQQKKTSVLNNDSSLTSRDSQSHSRLYLILTYMVEYDKVHYPLPLQLVENPDSSILKSIIARLRVENEMLRTSSSAVDVHGIVYQLRQENQMLKSKLVKEQGFEGSGSIKQQQTRQQEMIESMREEIDFLKVELNAKQGEIDAISRENEELQELVDSFDGLQETIAKIKQGEKMMAQQQQRIVQMEVEIDSVLSQLQAYQDNDRRQKMKIGILEKQLEEMKVMFTNDGKGQKSTALSSQQQKWQTMMAMEQSQTSSSSSYQQEGLASQECVDGYSNSGSNNSNVMSKGQSSQQQEQKKYKQSVNRLVRI